MTGLTIIVAENAPERFRAALSIAAAQAALGGAARVFLQGEAVALLAGDAAPGDAAHAAAGLPTLSVLLGEAMGLGVAVIACQSGLHLAGLDAAALDPRIATGGLVSLIQTLAEDRLVCV